MHPVRVGVVGAGLIGRKHVSVLRSGQAECALAGVADPSPVAADEARRLGYACHATVEELLDRERPDGVVVAVPNQLHLATGLACVERGIPVLVEKPVAGTIAEAAALVEAAEAAGVPTLTGHHRRHNPIMRLAAGLLRADRIGRPVAATAMWLAHKPEDYFAVAWRREPGGGPVLINASHEIDSLRMLLGDVEIVYGTCSNGLRGRAVEDTAAAVLRFASGALATLVISDTASAPWHWEAASAENPFFPQVGEDSLFIAGTSGSLSLPSLQLRRHEPGRESWANPLSAERQHVVLADAHVEQMKNFARVIRGSEEPVVTGRDGLITLATTLAITTSAETGLPVRVADLIALERSTTR